jgi:hypothetical protein
MYLPLLTKSIYIAGHVTICELAREDLFYQDTWVSTGELGKVVFNKQNQGGTEPWFYDDLLKI